MKHHFLCGAFLISGALIPRLTSAQALLCGDQFSAALCADGTLSTWGYNLQGQLGNGTNTYSSVPVQVSELTGITTFTTGAAFVLALKNDGTLWACGMNSNGEFGNGPDPFNSNLPLPAAALPNVTTLGAGSKHTLAVTSDGSLWTWGKNQQGQLGNGTAGANSNVPIRVDSLTDFIAVAGGGNHSLALEQGGTVWTWGYNADGQLGDGTNTNSAVPLPLTSLSGIAAIASKAGHSLALKADGTVWVWGYNLNGQLGIGTTTHSNVPVQVSNLTGITAIAAGCDHSIALKNDGTVWVWGSNFSGQHGNGTDNDSSVPVQAGFPAGAIRIAAGCGRSFALLSDGSVWACGNNGGGALGDGTLIDRSVPVQVTGLCDLATDVAVFVADDQLTAFPNPTTGPLTVEAPTAGPRQLLLRDVMGRIVHSTVFNGTRTEFDIAAQPSGVYSLTIRTGDVVITRKLIKK